MQITRQAPYGPAFAFLHRPCDNESLRWAISTIIVLGVVSTKSFLSLPKKFGVSLMSKRESNLWLKGNEREKSPRRSAINGQANSADK